MSGPMSAAIAAKAKSKTRTGHHVLNTRSRSLNVSHGGVVTLVTNIRIPDLVRLAGLGFHVFDEITIILLICFVAATHVYKTT